MPRIVITGAAGLIGQNLVARLRAKPGYSIIGIDKHPKNTPILRELYPEIEVIQADLAHAGAWSACFEGADAVIVNQAQIGGLNRDAFVANNITATKNILAEAARMQIPYLVGMSSSVVNSIAQDLYSETKRTQEALFDGCVVPHVVLRPTLMFGWFDRKHLGWLRRFMDRTPVFPIPRPGNFMRQPLYAGDMAAIIAACIERRITGTYDISGQERIGYNKLIQLIRNTVQAKALIVHIPYRLFWLLLWVYSKFNSEPPFTTKQLEALVIPESFPVIDWPGIFGVAATPLADALKETYLDPRYSEINLSF